MTTLPTMVVFDLCVPGGATDPPDPRPWLELLHRDGPRLAHAAYALGATTGCRVRDDATGLDFRWRPS